MRKLTGYIGAIIIVFALMGSILLGYALNINGTTATVNAYDPVTDVSGLYTHSQEPAYIDYNPASNYINYSSKDIAYTNNAINPGAGINSIQMKKINTNCIITIQNKDVTVDGVPMGTFTTGGSIWREMFFSDNLVLSAQDNSNLFYFSAGLNGTWLEILIDNVSLVLNNKNIIATGTDTNNIPFTYTIPYDNALVYWNGADFDYYNNRTGSQYTGNIPAYLSDNEPIFSYCIFGSQNVTTTNQKAHYMVSGTDTISTLFTTTAVSGGILHSDNVNIGASFHVLYPKYVYETSLGINYTESNRVNNYPIETDYDTYNTTSTASVDLSVMSAADYYTGTGYYWYYNAGSYSPVPGTTYRYDVNYFGNLKTYKLSDILSTVTIPVNTTTITITAPTYTYTQYEYVGPYDDNGHDIYLNIPNLVSKNWVNLGIGSTYQSDSINNTYIYNLNTGIVEIYDSSNIKVGQDTPNNIYLTFLPKNATTWMTVNFWNYPAWGQRTYTTTITGRDDPYLNLVFSTTGTVTNVHYADITKGYSIKNDNVSNTIWDNQYNNGNIQLLFRAETVGLNYHNDIIIGNNTISLNYNGNSYNVSLNGDDPVNIGTWRNIILDIDLVNGKLSAIPVKTFNSYTNVELMNTIIPVGDLVNPAPTNIIEWAPTPNSLMFNVYSTRVNMDTFGVVMVDPSLNIQNYFTNLNNFYRMNFYNFSTYGNTITINGQTSTVTNGTVTYEGETLRLKDLNITYADGHTYIGDSNIEVDLGATSDYTISMTGAWYFQTMLEEGYTQLKTIYEWDWGAFILDNTQFCIIYMGLALVGLVIARRFCNLSIIDYSVLVVSAIIAFTVQVVA